MSREKQKLECQMAEMLEIIEKAREIYANDITDHTENEYIREGLLDAGYRKQSELTPCDCCKFNPPSSGDGKPCIMCPAQAKMKGGAE